MAVTSASRTVADRMADAAEAVLATLDPDQRGQAAWAWNEDSEEERQRWFYTPTDHGGLPLAAMTPRQYQRTMALVASGLSPAGYVTVCTILGWENVLDHTEGFTGPSLDRERGRDPGMYYLRIFGSPGSPMWGWRFGGHHVSLNNLVINDPSVGTADEQGDGSLGGTGGPVVSTTPCFLGADPAVAPLLGGQRLRPLGGTEELARELVRSLDEATRAQALLTPRAPLDITTANRPRVRPGDRALPLGSLFRTQSATPALTDRMNALHERNERRYGLTEADYQAVELTATPRGVPATVLDSGQRELLRGLLDCYTGRVPSELGASDRYAGDRLDQLHIAWAGSLEPGQACYYRVQGPRLLIEYDNAQREANHAHSVWRDPEGDFGADLLAAHHAG